ncbi:Pentatricopeptide repeat-containing protein [Mucuna pruriens]|uniref:(S)-hydroxynitrile lyase n=1 Tax=Mucuna pruriens TaxID=157652 RepID=A0A371I7H0_MUCPR|nr:Pentatricopeptide repeat-containing protein [Mucuna pruriens]
MIKKEIEEKHFVLVHGVCHGAWCWYKLKSLLESAGHKVTALDLAASGINTLQIEDVHTFSEYSNPLLEFLTLLSPNEKVVLVGHSFGGMTIALAMDRFPEKISLGVFLSAFAPDTQHKPSHILEEYIKRYPISGWMDSEVSNSGSKTTLLLGIKFLCTRFYQLCSTEDLELARTSMRKGSLFPEDLSKANTLSKEGYGSVPCAYIVFNEDLAIPKEYQEWMVQNAGINLVREIKGADHMAITVTSLREARQLHALILTTTTSFNSQSPFVYNNILSMYARCGSLTDSHLVFDKMPRRTIVSYNALLAAYSRASSYHAISALELYTHMETKGLRPSSLTFTSLLQASSLLEHWWFGSSLHAKGFKLGLNDICVQTSLLNMYSNCRDLSSAELVFWDMVDRDDVAWNSFIVGYLKNNKIKEGVWLFIAMMGVGFAPTQFTYCMILNACSHLKDYSSGRLIHAHVIVRNVPLDLHLQNALVDMYCNVGNTQTAYRIFSRMENPDLVSWNSMIVGFSENEDGERAMNLFVQLQEMCFPKPDDYTYAGIISATGAFPSSSYGKPLHAEVIKTGFERSVFVGSTLVSMYFKNHESEAAQRVFCSISVKDVVLWTEMITGYSKMTDGISAIRCFFEMVHEAHEVDDYVLSGVLSVCADLAVLRQGEIIHCYAVKLGYDVEMSVSGSLIDMYAKNGNLEAAYLVFSQVSDPDLKCWNSILGGYSHHGMVEEALKRFEEILEQGLVPDQVTFLSLLSACSHSRLVEQGKFLWNYMNSIGLSPGPKHYSCMVTMLSRAALLEEAKEIINKSPYIEDNLELWRTLLSACVINKNFKVGIHAAEEVLRLKAEDGPTLVLLSNLYAAARIWDKVAEIRRNMRGMTLEKDPGLSWIEAKNDIHVFSSGDQSHPKADEVQAELHRLKRNMIGTENDESETQNACYISCRN